MRILVVMNMYPPYSNGGYPLLCQETVKALEQRGHQVLVLTSNKGLDGKRSMEPKVWRVFEYCPFNKNNELRSGHPLDLWRWYRREWKEQGFLQRALDTFKPEAIFIWATKGMSYSLAIRLMHYTMPKFAYVCGYWLIDHNKLGHLRRQYQFWQWGKASGLLVLTKKLVRGLLEKIGIPVDFEPLLFDRLAFNSEDMINGLASPASRTAPVKIYDSTPVERFAGVQPAHIERPRRILFVGRFDPPKDPVTLVQACALLQARPEFADLELTLAGWQVGTAYWEELRKAIAAAPSPERMHIQDPVAFEAMPDLFATHDILAVPSRMDPLPRVAAEGMASGLPTVVSNQTGISRLLVDRKEAMIFQAGDAASLAQCLGEIMGDPTLARSLSQQGRTRAVGYFSTKRMVDEIETFLKEGLENFHGASHAEQPHEERRADA